MVDRWSHVMSVCIDFSHGHLDHLSSEACVVAKQVVMEEVVMARAVYWRSQAECVLSC